MRIPIGDAQNVASRRSGAAQNNTSGPPKKDEFTATTHKELRGKVGRARRRYSSGKPDVRSGFRQRSPRATVGAYLGRRNQVAASLTRVPFSFSLWSDRPLGSQGPVTNKRYPSRHYSSIVEFRESVAPGTLRKWRSYLVEGRGDLRNLSTPPCPVTNPRRQGKVPLSADPTSH